MPVVLGALVGALIGAAIPVALAVVGGRRPSLKSVLLGAVAGALGGAVTVGVALAPGVAAAGTTGHVVALGAGGITEAAAAQAGENLVDGRRLDRDLDEAVVIGSSAGLLPVAGKALAPLARATAHTVARGATAAGADEVTRAAAAGPDALSLPGAAGRPLDASAPRTDDANVGPTDTSRSRGSARLPPGHPVDGALGEAPGPGAGSSTRPRSPPDAAPGEDARPVEPRRGIANLIDEATRPGPARADAPAPRRPPRPSVHAPPPAWLVDRLEATVAAVRAGRGPRGASDDDVRRFFGDTWEHANEVNALVEALGGRARPIPSTAPSGGLRGVHDFGERASVRRVEALIERLEREPLRGRDGAPLPVPDWLRDVPRRARASGETSVDIGKLSPEVAAGLSQNPPDPFSLELHRLSPHHQVYPHAGRPDRLNNQLIENIADKINAMRQWRFYKEPMPFSRIRSILHEELESGALPREAAPLIERALRAQELLERLGRVNPYHLADTGP